MLYATDEYHLLLRRQAIEHMDERPEDYVDFIADAPSFDLYLKRMQRDMEWADDCIIRATADFLNIEIRMIGTHDVDFESIVRPETDEPLETIYLGYIQRLHYCSTVSQNEPQLMLPGGTTSDGVILSNTFPMDCSLTWLFNLVSMNEDLRKELHSNKGKHMKQLNEALECYIKGNSVDGKRKWYNHVAKKRASIYESIVSIDKNDIQLLALPLQESPFGKATLTEEWKGCSNDQCEQTLPSKFVNLDATMKDFIPTQTQCSACDGVFTREIRATVASPFIIVFGDNSLLGEYPTELTIAYEQRELKYELDFVSIERVTSSDKYYSCFIKHRGHFWYNYEPLAD